MAGDYFHPSIHMKLIDLTHPFTDDMPVYPGDPQSKLKQTSFIPKDGYTDHKLETLMHVGTHMDAPLHMIEGGKTMDEMPLETFFGKGVLLDARGTKTVDESLTRNITIKPGSIVLIFTGHARHYHTPSYFEGFPKVSESFARTMVERKVSIVGMDIIGPDDPPYPTHKILLGNGILIIENLTNLDKLIGVKEFDVIALPMKLHADASPVRVVAIIHE